MEAEVMKELNYFNIKDIIFLVNRIIEQCGIHLSSEETPKIYQQLLLLYLGVDKNNEMVNDLSGVQIDSNHYYAALALIFSHLIDDFADNPEIITKYKEEVLKILEDMEDMRFPIYDGQSGRYIRAFEDLIQLISNSDFINAKGVGDIFNQLRESFSSINSEYFERFAITSIKIILAGLIWTSEDKSEQDSWISYYKSVSILVVNEKYKTELPLEILLSETASSLDLVSAFYENVDLVEMNLWNRLYGPLIMLSNFEEEISEGIVHIFGERAGPEDYESFLNNNFERLMTLLTVRYSKGLEKNGIAQRINQFKIAVNAFLSPDSNYTFEQFPRELSQPLKQLYLSFVNKLETILKKQAA